MTPFSPLYFIKENKAKCILLMFMLFLGWGAYLGGLYVSNPMDNYSLNIDYYDQFAKIYLLEFDEDIRDSFRDDASKYDNVQLIELAPAQSFSWESIMGFNSGDTALVFKNIDDFKDYCAYMGIECDFDSLSEYSMIMSDMFAKNRDLKIGDKIDENYADNIYDEFTLKAITQENGYMQYFITNDDDGVGGYLLIGKNGAGKDEVYSAALELRGKYTIDIYDHLREELESDFNALNTIYFFIIVLLSLILAVTINAAFVGMYQRRNFEFAVYRAIGISRRRIISKIIGEIICMDILVLIFGGAIFFAILYLINNLIFYPAGLYLSYYDTIAMLGLAISNLTVIIPLIITRCRQMLKADICEY